VRGFTQDDAHICCHSDELEAEILQVVSLIEEFLRVFRFRKHRYRLGTRPAKANDGDPSSWAHAIGALRSAVQKLNLDVEVDEGGGAFYGPKLDVHVEDAHGRAWQLSTGAV